MLSKQADETVQLHIARIACLTVTREARRNALNSEVFAAIARSLATCEADPTVRALIITGAGDRAFIAGADLSEVVTLKTTHAAKRFSRMGQKVMQQIEHSPLPTIAAINGAALGGGCELALACDLRIADPRAMLGLPEVTLGLIPGFGGTQRLPRLIGRSAALRMILTGKPVDANEALHLGLIDEIAEPGKSVEAAAALAELIVASPPGALAAAKRAIYAGFDMRKYGGEFGLETEAKLFGSVVPGQEAVAGLAKFFARRSAS